MQMTKGGFLPRKELKKHKKNLTVERETDALVGVGKEPVCHKYNRTTANICSNKLLQQH